MWAVFVAIYFSYLILGPHWISNLIIGQPLQLVDSVSTFARRSVYISYISLLYIAYFLYNPSMSTFIFASMISMIATSAYYFRYGTEQPIPSHLLLNLTILMMGRAYATVQLYITMLLVSMYPILFPMIYISN